MNTVVIGGGQAGLAAGHFLARKTRDFVILEAGEQPGRAWRDRWDSLRLFTPASFSALPGLRFPSDDPDYLPGKDEMADYLVAYADRFSLPVRLGAQVTEVTRTGDTYQVRVGDEVMEARHVVVATGPTTTPRVPAFASELSPSIHQMHSVDYRNPDQFGTGPIAVVGAGNSGAEISLELAEKRTVHLAGRDTGRMPIKLGGTIYNLSSKLMSTRWPWGRKMAAQQSGKGTPLVRVTPEALAQAGVRRVPKLAGVRRGLPVAEGLLDVESVLWCTGYSREWPWLKLPVLDSNGSPRHHRGVVEGEPGLYFLGLPFLYAPPSSLIGGVGFDAEHVVDVISQR